jgi:phosphatidate cytidylyltransferase
MKSRILVAIVYVPALFCIIFFLPGYVFAIAMSCICAISAFEMLSAVGLKRNPRVVVYGVAVAAVFPVCAHLDLGPVLLPALFLLLTSLVFVEATIAYNTDRHISLQRVFAALFGGAAIPSLLSYMVDLRDLPDGRLFVLLPVIVAFITDAGAYFVGVTLGKHKVFPRISPKKTVEGCIGGLVAGVVATVVYGIVLVFETTHEVDLPVLALYGLVGAFMTELGDLAFSFVKREYEIKDFGRILLAHGGMLDRFDSMVFVAPAMYLLVSALPGIYVI